MDSTIIYKYLSGLTTDSENRELLAWLNASAENKAEFFEMKAIWNAQSVFAQDAAKATGISLGRLNKRIDALSGKGSVQKAKRRRIVVRFMSAAAILLLFLVGGYYVAERGFNLHLIAGSSTIEYTNNHAGDSVLVVDLPDGTKVWLSSNTTLTCPKALEGSRRIVHLSGQAFFEVKNNPDRPFIVKTEACNVRVLGTSFSVGNRPSEEVAETVLMSGSVQIEEPDGETVATLRAGQQALFAKNTKKIEIRSVDANSLTSWRFGLISLTDVTIRDILNCLEELYGVKIKMNVSQIENRNYNFSFKRSKGARSALDQLSFITGVSAEILPQ